MPITKDDSPPNPTAAEATGSRPIAYGGAWLPLVLRYWELCSEEVHRYTDEQLNHCVLPVLVDTAQVELHKEGVSGYTWAYTAYIIMPQIDDVQCLSQTHPQLNNGTTDYTRSSNLKCVSAPSTTLEERTPNWAGQNPESIFQEAINHGILSRTSSRYQAFEKLLWKPSEDASQRHLGIKCHCQYN